MARLLRGSLTALAGVATMVLASSCGEPATPAPDPTPAVMVPPPLTAAEIEARLDQKIDLEMVEEPVETVITFLHDTTRLAFVYDPKVEAAGLPKRPVTIALKQVSRRQALWAVLLPAKMGWQLVDGKIQICGRMDLPKEEREERDNLARRAMQNKISCNIVPGMSLDDLTQYMRDITGVRVEVDDTAEADGLGDEEAMFSANGTPALDAFLGMLKRLDADLRFEAGVVVVFENHPHKRELKKAATDPAADPTHEIIEESPTTNPPAPAEDH